VNAPIRLRVTAWFVALLAAILAAVAAFVAIELRRDLVDGQDRSLRPALGQIAVGFRREGPAEFTDQSATVLSGGRPASQVLGPGGRVLLAFGDPVSRRPMLAPDEIRAARAGRVTARTRRLDGASFRVVATAVRRRGARRVVAAAESLAPVERASHRALVLLVLAFPIALAAAAAGGWWLARRALGPLDRLTASAEAIGPGALAARVPVPGTRDEVERLARTLNTMLDRLERGAADQRRLVADASHELRSPLAAMRAELDVSLRADTLDPAARAVLESAREEVDRMSRTVDDLLTLARVDEHGAGPARAPVDLALVAARGAEGLAATARRRGVELTTQAAPAFALGDAEQLGHVVRNLVDNAIGFSPPGGRVRVASWQRDGAAGVSVEDDGPGVPPGERERIFERFYRLDRARSRHTGGSGLGLAIAAELAAAHAGRIEVESRPSGGSRFSLILPAAPTPAPTAPVPL
jgi:heavy metal sensor kinase